MNGKEKTEFKDIIKEVFEEEIKPFYIDRETHYQDHVFIKELRSFFDGLKDTTLKTAIRIFVTIIIGGCIAGFLWGKGYFHK